MIKIDNLTPPSAKQFNVVTAGIRNAFKSYDRADSDLVDIDEHEVFAFGEKDFGLANTLVSGDSPSHRKFLRQLPLVMDITAPLFFWKQLDTYKVGTTANSESTMHCLTKDEFKLEDFSIDHLKRVRDSAKLGNYQNIFIAFILNDLNYLRKKYIDTEDIKYWYALNEALPQSYLQKRTWAANYEVILTIMAQRIHHKLPEWRSLIVYWLKNIPYLLNFAISAGIVKRIDSNVVINDDSEEVLYSLELN